MTSTAKSSNPDLSKQLFQNHLFKLTATRLKNLYNFVYYEGYKWGNSLLSE